MNIPDQKKELRREIKVRISEMSEKARTEESAALCEKLLELIPEGSTVAAYFPLDTEADIKTMLEMIINRDDDLYLPRFDNGVLTMHKVDDLSKLIPGAFDIPEPSGDTAQPDYASLTHVLVPGRAFDRNGDRLGRGNGGYDFWIEKQRAEKEETIFIGCSLECQLVPDVPTDDHDQRMDIVVTAREIIH